MPQLTPGCPYACGARVAPDECRVAAVRALGCLSPPRRLSYVIDGSRLPVRHFSPSSARVIPVGPFFLSLPASTWPPLATFTALLASETDALSPTRKA